MNTNDTEIATAIESTLQSEWPLQIWVWIVATLLAALFVFWIYSNERGAAGKAVRITLAGLRFTILITIVWMLCGWSTLQYRTEKPELVIVVDRSSSMSTKDVISDESPPRSRLNSVLTLLEEVPENTKDSLTNLYRVRWFSVAESIESIPSLFADTQNQLDANGLESRLADGLMSTLQRQTGRGTAALLFFSDGINTAGATLEEAQELANSAAIPVFTYLTGRETSLPDVRLANLMIDQEVYFGDRITAEVSVIGNESTDAQVTVSLTNAATGKMLDQVQVQLEATNPTAIARLRFVPDAPGEQTLLLEASPIKNEIDVENNKLETSVRVQDKTIRALLVQEQPSYEFRFLKSLLDRSKQLGDQNSSSFVLTSVLQESDPVYVQQDPSAFRLVPSSEEKLQEYDVFIFGKFNPGLVSRRAQENIFEAVTSSGAGCIFIYGDGKPADELLGWPLAKLLPFQPVGTDTPPGTSNDKLYRWQPTPIGVAALPMQLADSQAMTEELWQRMPTLSSVSSIGPLKNGAQVLSDAIAEGQTRPLLVTQFAGAGRVAFQATDETFHWTSLGGTDVYHQRYWGQMLRWLSRGRLGKEVQNSELMVEPKQSTFGQTIRFEARLGNEFPMNELPELVTVSVENDDGPRRNLTLKVTSRSNRIYQCFASGFSPGAHRALVLDPASQAPSTQSFTVAPPPGEQASLQANKEGMRKLANGSRGRFYQGSEFNRMFTEIPRGNPSRLGALPPVPLWNSPWIAFLIVGLLTTEWLIRRRVRML